MNFGIIFWSKEKSRTLYKAWKLLTFNHNCFLNLSVPVRLYHNTIRWFFSAECLTMLRGDFLRLSNKPIPIFCSNYLVEFCTASRYIDCYLWNCRTLSIRTVKSKVDQKKNCTRFSYNKLYIVIAKFFWNIEWSVERYCGPIVMCHPDVRFEWFRFLIFNSGILEFSPKWLEV